MGSPKDPTSESVAPGSVRQAIDAFLARRRIAFVGLSTNKRDFSRMVHAKFLAQGYDVVPVHPSASEVAGLRAWPRVQDIPESVEAALVMTPARASADVVRDCVEAGIDHVWLHRGGGPGAASDEAVAIAREHGLSLVPGECPMMFLGRPGFIHWLHALGKKLVGSYPR